MTCFNKIAEKKILEAIEKGELDNLEGFGKPLDNSDYFKAPPELRMAYHILKNSEIVPEEIQILKSIHQLTKHIKHTLTKEEKERLAREKILLENKLNILREQRKLQRF